VDKIQQALCQAAISGGYARKPLILLSARQSLAMTDYKMPDFQTTSTV